jgi:uncharacterized protein
LEVLIIIAACLIALYVVIAFVFYFFQEPILFKAQPLEADFNYNFDFPFEERNYTMPDGAVLNALFIPSKEEKGVILYFHGNAGNLDRWGRIAHYFTRYGYSILIPDYRGYGKSTGTRSMLALFGDALTLHDELLKKYKEEDIVIYGRSIGTGIATWLASKVNSKAIILETPYYSVSDLITIKMLLIPTGWLLRYPFPSFKYIKSIKAPIHIIHGTLDVVVPHASGMKLYKENKEELNISFTSIKGGRHNNLVNFEEFHEVIRKALI